MFKPPESWKLEVKVSDFVKEEWDEQDKNEQVLVVECE